MMLRTWLKRWGQAWFGPPAPVTSPGRQARPVKPRLEGLEDRQLMSVTVLHNPLGTGADVRLEADHRLYMDRGSSHQLLDDGCRAVAAGVDRYGNKAIYDLKNDSSDPAAPVRLLDSTDGFHWQLLDDGARQIAPAMTPTGQAIVFDLKADGRLFQFGIGGAFFVLGAGPSSPGRVTEIAQGVLWDGQPAVFVVYSYNDPYHSSILHAYTSHGFVAGGVGTSVNYRGSIVYETKVILPIYGGLALTEAYSLSNGGVTLVMMQTTYAGTPL
jgi:hypothetical protein